MGEDEVVRPGGEMAGEIERYMRENPEFAGAYEEAALDADICAHVWRRGKPLSGADRADYICTKCFELWIEDEPPPGVAPSEEGK
jgi:hypothetical protein